MLPQVRRQASITPKAGTGDVNIVFLIGACGLAVLAFVTGLARCYAGAPSPASDAHRPGWRPSAARGAVEILAAAGLWIPLLTRTAHGLLPLSAALLLALAAADVARHISHPEPEDLYAPATVGTLAVTILGLLFVDATG